MEKSERETHEFMNVESFSQLPFIRPAPRKKPAAAGIRLFGIEFDTADDPSVPSSMSKPDRETLRAASANSEAYGNNNKVDSSRRFECHYCRRNFPTSQALGGAPTCQAGQPPVRPRGPWRPFGHLPFRNHSRRIPATATSQTMSREPLPLLGRDVSDKPGRLGWAVEGICACEAKAGMQEPVSLDLHL
ncbi:hypothetical protein MLD38_015964 [Melastoma candidum]|uniref:Uncharacterized protein n=1 Tax=Melastoma candidum TaxID=119954 RepID=A0ACB9RHG5_9MYRT|nr:hypothetical protein MLD38_015964 [Melastoma candidum]